MDDLLGVISKDKVGEGITNILRNTDPMTEAFITTAGEVAGVMIVVIDGFPKCVLKQGTDVRDLTSEMLEGSFQLEGTPRDAVVDVTTVLHAQKPSICWCSSAIHNSINHGLDFLVEPFSIILLLMIGFRLPVINSKGA